MRGLIRRSALLAVAAVLAACGGGQIASSSPSPSPSASAQATLGLATFDQGGLAFEYPPTWRVFHHEELSTFSSLIAYLATVDVPAPCATSQVSGGTQVSCTDRFRLEPNTLVVKIEAEGRPVFDILDHRPAGATPMTVGGLPAFVETVRTPLGLGADVMLRWTISMPGSVSNYYSITAMIRGPEVERLQAQVEAMVASLLYDPPVVPLPSGSAAAESAAATALHTLAKNSPAWACFPSRPGAGMMLISSLPMGPPLARPQLATCTTQIEATSRELWRMTLTIRLPQRDPGAGTGQTLVVWVNPDGTPGQVSGSSLGP